MNGDTASDVVLIGGGIMSATLGVLLHRLQPDWSIDIFERLPEVADESSAAWNNAGTGHSGLCEMNYTTERSDGTVDISTAVAINEQFQLTREFWANLVETGVIADPKSFIHPMPHMTFVQGEDDVALLRRRHQALRANPLFAGMQFSDDPATIGQWAPLLTESRTGTTPIAATRDDSGTDVDFGSLTRQLFAHLESNGARIRCGVEVDRLRKNRDGTWRVYATDKRTRKSSVVRAKFVFVGAGGWALKLLQKAGLPEARDYGLLPVSGRFLRCDNPDVVHRHEAKVYGKPPVGAPPMAWPHLDTRVVDGRRSLLFGPYAGANPKFLKDGSLLDPLSTIRPHNIKPLLWMVKDNLSLVELLVSDLVSTKSMKLDALREFLPAAEADDWYMITAGQRAQIVKKDPVRGGVLQFGTEVVAAHDGTMAGVLGASPGASTAVPIMIGLLNRCFPERRDAWASTLRRIVPTSGTKLSEDPALAARTLATTAHVLGL